MSGVDLEYNGSALLQFFSGHSVDAGVHLKATGGAVWGRPGLPIKTRSLITVALLACLNRPEELRRTYDAQLQAYRNAYGGNMSDQLLKQLGIDQNGRTYGQFEATGVRPSTTPRTIR